MNLSRIWSILHGLIKSRKALILFGQITVIIATLIRNKTLAVYSLDLFATLTLALTTVQFFIDFGVFGTDLVALKYKQSFGQEKHTHFLSNFLVYYFFLSIISVSGFFILYNFIPTYFASLSNKFLLFISIVIVISFINQGYISIRRAQNSLTKIVVLNVITFLGILTSLTFSFLNNNDFFLLLLSLPVFLSLIFVLFDLRHEFNLDRVRWGFMKNYILNEFQYGFTFSLASMMPALIFMGIRFWLVKIDGSLMQLTYFVTGFSIIHGYFGIILNVFSQDIIPKLTYKQHSNDFIVGSLKKETKRVAIISLVLSVIFTFLGEIILEAMYSSEFRVVKQFIIFSLPGMVFRSFAFIQNLSFVIKNKPRNLFKLELIYNCLFISISIMLIFLTHDFTYIGIAYSISYIIYFLISYSFFKKLMR
jgi:O-antigen/teichoic acid export membrane protein